MSVSLQINNLQVATIEQTANPQQRGVFQWLAHTCNNTKNWNDIAKLSRDFSDWVAEAAKYQENFKLAEWAETSSKIFGQATKATLIPFLLGATAFVVRIKTTDPKVDIARKVAIFVMAALLVGRITLGIGILTTPLTVFLFAWYTVDFIVQVNHLLKARQLATAQAIVQDPTPPMIAFAPVPLQQLVERQQMLAMIQVAKAVASLAGGVLGELCPAYALTNATLSLGGSLLGGYLLHARETSQFYCKIC